MPSLHSVLQILVVRPDRIGDVVLSTPVFDVLKRYYPRSKITVMVRKEVASVVRGLSSVDEVLVFDPEGKHAGLSGLFNLIREFRDRGFRIAVVLQSQWKIAAALFAAGVKHRIGPLSKLHSFLFFNRGMRQRRSQVEMHEADYNLQLLRRLGIRLGTRNVQTHISVSDEMKEKARLWLAARGFVDTPHSSPLVALHPGMGGSALNWPVQNYNSLISSLLQEGIQVMVTAGPSELTLISQLKSSLKEFREKIIFYEASPEESDTSLEFLSGLYWHASVVVAPSTGPLHLAVALGKAVVTFFPPIRVQSAIRWGPYLSDESRASVLVPEVYCGQDFACRGPLCNYYPCMDSISVTQALEEVHRQLANHPQ